MHMKKNCLNQEKLVGWSDQGMRDLRESGENCLKYLKGGEAEKRGGDKKILKRGASWIKGWVP